MNVTRVSSVRHNSAELAFAMLDKLGRECTTPAKLLATLLVDGVPRRAGGNVHYPLTLYMRRNGLPLATSDERFLYPLGETSTGIRLSDLLQAFQRRWRAGHFFEAAAVPADPLKRVE